MLEIAATNTRFIAAALGLMYIRKDLRHIEHMSNNNKLAGNKFFRRCEETFVRETFNMTPKGNIPTDLI